MKQLSAILICLLFATFTAPFVSAQTDAATTKIKALAAKYSTKKKRVKVKTRDGKELKGYISRTDADAFDVTDAKSGVSTLAYADVSSVSNISGISKTTIITLAGLGAAGVVVIGILAQLYGDH